MQFGTRFGWYVRVDFENSLLVESIETKYIQINVHFCVFVLSLRGKVNGESICLSNNICIICL